MFPLFLSGLATRELRFWTSAEKPSSCCKFVYENKIFPIDRRKKKLFFMNSLHQFSSFTPIIIVHENIRM